MTSWKIYHNPQCSKSREALKHLQDRYADIEIREYLKVPPTKSELQELMGMLIGPVENLVRIKDDLFKEAPFELTRENIVQVVSQNPRYLERPLIVHNGKAIVARPLSEITKIL